MNGKGTGWILLLVAAGLALYMTMFTVDQREKAIKFRFGQIIKADYAPGLHFKFPLVDKVRKYDARILTMDNQPEQFLTSEVKYVIMDFFVKWRIDDVQSYYVATEGNEGRASTRIISIINDGLRNEVAIRTIPQVVSAERSDFMSDMLHNVREVASEFGVEIVDVRVKRIDLPPGVSESVYERMRTERERIAKQLRAEGEQIAEEIRSSADRERTVILADAYRQSEIIRGEGDAQSAAIYADAYNQDREFYNFFRSLQGYRTSFTGQNDLMVIDPDGEFFRYLNSAGGE